MASSDFTFRSHGLHAGATGEEPAPAPAPIPTPRGTPAPDRGAPRQPGQT